MGAAASYRVATVDDLQDIGITAFGTNAWTPADEGDRLLLEHQEDDGDHELYVVLRGRARFEIDTRWTSSLSAG